MRNRDFTQVRALPEDERNRLFSAVTRCPLLRHCAPRTHWATLLNDMRQTHEAPPNVFRTRGLWRGIGSKDCVPATNAQRVGAFLLGVIYIVGALAAIASTFWFRAELTADLRSETAGLVIGFLLVFVVLVGAGAVGLLGLRLLRSAFRFALRDSSQ